jgi:stage III sporulation protein AF
VFLLIAMLTDWIKYIIFVVLFASFLELLLPSSSMQRFVRVIMGLFIMLAILNPIIGVVQQYLASTKQIPALSTNSENSISIINEANNIASEREKLSLELYKKELSQQMRILIMAIDGVADANVAVDIKAINKGNVTSVINSVVVYIKPGISVKNAKVAAVAKISIGEENGKKEEIHVDLKKRIIDMITELYQIPKDKVEIRMLHS